MKAWFGIWDLGIGDLGDAAVSGGVGIRCLCFDDGGGGGASTHTRGGCAPQDEAGVAEEGIAAAVEPVTFFRSASGAENNA